MKRFPCIVPQCHVLVVGMGLIGASYAKALSARGYTVSAITRGREVIDRALSDGVITQGTTEPDAAETSTNWSKPRPKWSLNSTLPRQRRVSPERLQNTISGAASPSLTRCRGSPVSTSNAKSSAEAEHARALTARGDGTEPKTESRS